MRPEPYRPRKVRFHGVRERAGWRVKQYSISRDGAAIPWPVFAAGLSQADATLPEPARTAVRPGLAISIAHRGRGADYVILGWWDNENELPVRVFVRDSPADEWRPARDESFCVWDLEVIGYERDAYVATVLSGDAQVGSDAYLARHLGELAESPPA